jgi:adenylate cyclase
VTYGNIGTREQLEFTVIGDAANCAARIESMRKSLGAHALLSEQFAAHFPGRFESLGCQELLGVDGSQEILAMREARHGAGDKHVS